MNKIKAPLVIVLFILCFQLTSAQRKDMLEVEPFSLLHDSLFHWKMTEIEEWYFQLANSDENVNVFTWESEIGERIIRCIKSLEHGLVEHIWIKGEKPNSFKDEKFDSLTLTIESAGTAKKQDFFYKYHKDVISGSRVIRSQRFWWNYYVNCLGYLNQMLGMNTFRGSDITRKESYMTFQSKTLNILVSKSHYDFETGFIKDQIGVYIHKL